MRAGTMTDFEKWKRAQTRRTKTAAEEMRRAMTKAWESASEWETDPEKRQARAWTFMQGWLRSMEHEAGIATTTDPDGRPHPRD